MLAGLAAVENRRGDPPLPLAVEFLGTLTDAEGVWRCRTVFNCTTACPRDIKVTQAISEVKRALLTGEVNYEAEPEPAHTS